MSKTRGPSKAQTILNEAWERCNVAQQAVNEAHTTLQTAQAVHTAYQLAYYALEKSLARATPRMKQEPVKKGTATDPMCAQCGRHEDASAHDGTYLSSHPFVPNAGKRSSRKGAGPVSEEMANAATVGG